MDIQKTGFLSIDQLADQYLSKQQKTSSATNEAGMSFGQVLQSKALQHGTIGQAGELKFSKHASVRLADRNIELSNEQLERLKDGAQKAEQKGIKDSLVIVDELAFIVNIPNHTVVTAMDSTETNDNVFTNINGAVIM
ncbi:MAG: flagellar protein [Lachnospiraceae bacterium]|nr:flagellar protein [Lachnospiraceae bacterium]